MSNDNQAAGGNSADAGSTTAQAGDWFTSLPSEMQSEGSLQSFKGKGVADFAKSYVEAQKMIGGSIRLPKADTPQAERDAFMSDLYGKLGRPADAKSYQYKLPELPAEMGGFSEPHMQKFNETAHKLGLNNQQVQGVLDFYGEYAKGMTPDWEGMRKTAHEALNKEFGKNADTKIKSAQRVLMTKGGKEAIEFAEQTGLGNAPWFIKMLAEFGEMAGEKSLVSGDTATDGSLDQINASIAQMRNDPKSAYNDVRHKDHEAAVAKMDQLYRQRLSMK